MNIGLDAKRAYHNGTGLGFFSRTLINLLATYYPENNYYLFNPKPGSYFHPPSGNVHEIRPQKNVHKLLSSVWRSKWVTQDLKKLKIDIYNGLSQEIPVGIEKTGIASVVTIHDLFPVTHPQDFKPIDTKIYRSKLSNACKNARMIMATSEETRKDIIAAYGIRPEKICVAYQSCDPLFTIQQSEEMRASTREKYNLPKNYFLHVGTIIERKNLMTICKAMQIIKQNIDIPLVVVGKGGAYKEKVKQWLVENNLQDRVIFLSDTLAAAGKKPFVATEDFPAIFQMATAMIYPSFYEGFGIPIVEAMSSGVPVITSQTSCLPEIGGDAAYYVDPHSSEEMAKGLEKLYGDVQFRAQTIAKGFENAKRFAPEVYVKSVMDIYRLAHLARDN